MEDMQELKKDVKELLQRSAVHNELLRTHEARSIALQNSQDRLSDRLAPIEKHVDLVNILGKVTGAVVVGFVIQALVRLVLKI